MIEILIKAMKEKGYVVFENDTKNHNLNLVGVRSATNIPNAFDDKMYVFWKYKGKWSIRSWDITTDPGTYWLENPMKKLGTAILKEGQYRGAWELGKHKNKYKALTQKKEVTVLRDGNGDNVLDFDTAVEETGFFGINHHHASYTGTSVNVEKWSAGCQVTANINDYNMFMDLIELAKANFGNSFTYTLLNESDL